MYISTVIIQQELKQNRYDLNAFESRHSLMAIAFSVLPLVRLNIPIGQKRFRGAVARHIGYSASQIFICRVSDGSMRAGSLHALILHLPRL